MMQKKEGSVEMKETSNAEKIGNSRGKQVNAKHCIQNDQDGQVPITIKPTLATLTPDSLLQSHLPALAQQGRPLYGYARAPETEEHIRQNAERVVAAMRDLGLELPLSPNRICAKPVPDARDMLLVVLYLYQRRR